MNAACLVSGCDQPAKVKGLCKRHYQQQWSTGSPEIKRPNPRGTLEQRFWRHVNRADGNGCWEWTAFRDKDGYGKLRVGASNKPAHAVSWALHFGEVPAGSLVRHRCHNAPCVNPSHLMLGDHNANMRDRVEAGHYARGEAHPMSKFSDQVVKAVRDAPGTYEQIGERFGMSASQVGNIKRGVQRQEQTA